MSDDLSLTINGNRKISGWTEVRVTRGIERCPNDFDIAMTELYPGDENLIVVQPGDACQVKIGDDLVITGYVDRYNASISATGHDIRLNGRGKCQDLVDCAALWPNNQISGSSVFQIAQKLAGKYGINVTATGDKGRPIQQLSMNWGETSFEIIERICRYSGLLAYEGTDGGLILSRVGTDKAASGFAQGKNVEEARIVFSQDQRFSEYIVRRLSMSPVTEAGNGGDIVAHFYDKGVKRHRLRYIIAESGMGAGTDIAYQRGAWECARRFGRSACLALTTDSWRDSSGKLWTPNTLVDVSLPILKAEKKTWCISEVTYRRGRDGTKADLTIMPPEAFLPEPFNPFPVFQEVSGA